MPRKKKKQKTKNKLAVLISFVRTLHFPPTTEQHVASAKFLLLLCPFLFKMNKITKTSGKRFLGTTIPFT